MNKNLKRLQSRVASAADATLAEKNVVSTVDVLLRIGSLPQARLDEWRQGRLSYLEASACVCPTARRVRVRQTCKSRVQ
jgi:hypothetical protein